MRLLRAGDQPPSAALPEMLVSEMGGERDPVGSRRSRWGWPGHWVCVFLTLSFFKTSSSFGTWDPIKEHTWIVTFKVS